MELSSASSEKIANLLATSGSLSQDRLTKITTQCGSNKSKIVEELLKKQFTTEADIAKIISRSYSIKQVDLKEDQIKPELINILPTEFVKKETQTNSLKKVIRTEYRDSEHVGKLTEKFEGTCEILDSFYSQHYERYAYTANVMGNLINFWAKENLPVGERRKITAKIKEHSKNRLFSANETKLNYVKIYKV
jgi:hypothetical protein